MTVLELLEACENAIAKARGVHLANPVVEGHPRSDRLLTALTDACQGSVDFVFGVNDEPDVPEGDVRRFVGLMEDYIGLVGEVERRADLERGDAALLKEFRLHSQSRIDRMKGRLAERSRSLQFFRSVLGGKPVV